MLSRNAAKRSLSAILNPEGAKTLMDNLTNEETTLLRYFTACTAEIDLRRQARLERQISDLADPIDRIEQQVAHALEWVGRREQLRILDWCSEIPYGAHHDLIKEQRTAGTGKWLLAHPNFLRWRYGSEKSIMLLYGFRKFIFRR